MVEETQSIAEFIASVDHKGRREDAERLLDLFQEVTGWNPVLYKPGVIGFGSYDYTYETGHSGRCYATGFAPRKANMVLYILPGYTDFSPILQRMGKHKLGKSCCYLGRITTLDLDAMGDLIRAGLDDLGTRWTIEPS